MPEPIEVAGGSVEEAIEEALRRLEATEDEVEIRILEEGVGRARVLARMRQEREPVDLAPDAGSEPDATAEELGQQADAAEDFLNGLLDRMDVDAEVEVAVEQSGVSADLVGEDAGLLIGRHGATIDAIQEVTRAAVKTQTGLWPRVVVDAEGYQARRRSQLVRRARDLAVKVKRSGKPIEMSAMTSVERKIVHEAIAQLSGVRTESAGQGVERHVVIHPA